MRTPASGPSSLRVYSQTFTIDPADFAGGPHWSMFFQRGDGSNGEVFPYPIYVMGAEVEVVVGPLFADGFESGNTNAWSDAVPP